MTKEEMIHELALAAAQVDYAKYLERHPEKFDELHGNVEDFAHFYNMAVMRLQMNTDELITAYRMPNT